MCELMAIAAALVFSLLALSARRAGRPASALATTALAFWGAALMWAVDCAHAALEGEPLLDLSWDDAALGAVVVAAGIALCAVLRVREARRLRRAGA